MVFPDGHVREYSTDIIAESSFSTVDDEGHEILFFQDVVDHRCIVNAPVPSQEAWIVMHNWNKVLRQMTKGWELCVEWKDKSTSWIPPKDLKAPNPLQVAQYAIAHNNAGDPAFSWWVQESIKYVRTAL